MEQQTNDEENIKIESRKVIIYVGLCYVCAVLSFFTLGACLYLMW